MRTASLLSLLALSLLGCRKEEPVDLDGDGATAEEDCDDLDASAFPGADERCDGVDNDCDGEVDNAAVDALTFYADADGDGFGDATSSVQACEQPEGYVQSDTDCDDSSALFHPGAAEADCTDPADYNCDGSVGYADADGDGFAACEECDDSRADVSPDADEVCDEVDNDCDGDVDDSPVDAPTWYLDADSDSYGAAAISLAACEAPAGYVADSTDCDDLHAASHPGGTEVCDGHDNDCEGTVDVDATDAPTWYSDADGDLYGDPEHVTVACEAPAGAVENGEDCDDAHASVRPGGTEVCDSLDNDCDGSVDVGAVDAATWHADSDDDGFGDATTTTRACTQPQGYVSDARDCDDSTDAASPAQDEVCGDGLDNDCDGDTDDADAVDASAWHLDADGDGHGRSGVGQRACEAPEGYVASTDDCDDLDETVFPGAPERCDGQLNDCDGSLPADESDADGDGYMACEDDCDDAVATVYPGAPEHCDGADEDCNGLIDDGAVDQTTWHLDEDGDGYGHRYITRTQCEAPAQFIADGTDCDDEDATTNPGEREIPGNGKDDTCDGLAPELYVYVTARYSGELYAVNYHTGDVDWIVDGLGELRDAAVAADGTVYAVTVDDGLVEIDPLTQVATPALTGYADATGVWVDDSAGEVLLTTYGGTIVALDRSSGAVTELATGVSGGLSDVVRFAGEDDLYVSLATDEVIARYDAAADAWETFSELGQQAWSLLPAAQGGFWVSGSTDQLLTRVDAWGQLMVQSPVGRNLHGLCADPYGDGGVLFTEHTSNGVWLADEEGSFLGQLGGALAAPRGCATNGLQDLDGDGEAALAYGGTDCDDADDSINIAGVDVFGDGVDDNCDFVDGNDGDGDGVPVDHSNPDCADQDDTDPSVGFSPECVQASCVETLAVRGPGTPSGVYTIDPDGDLDLSNAFEVYCDMETQGGGWTLLAKMTNADGVKHWDSYSANWYAESTFGDPLDPTAVADAKSPAWDTMAMDQLMVARFNGASSWAAELVSATGCLGGNPLIWAFQRNSEYDGDCAMSCGTTLRTGYWAQTYTDATLRFRCSDNDGTTYAYGGYRCSTDDNSMITTLVNGSYLHQNFGLGGGYGTSSQDWDYSTDDYGNPGDNGLMLVFGR